MNKIHIYVGVGWQFQMMILLGMIKRMETYRLESFNIYNDWKKEGPEVDIEKASNHWYKMSAEVSKFDQRGLH